MKNELIISYWMFTYISINMVKTLRNIYLKSGSGRNEMKLVQYLQYIEVLKIKH